MKLNDLYLPGFVLCSATLTVSCCFRAREHGGVCAVEMPLAGYRVVDAFGYGVRAFVLKLQVRPSGRTRQLQRRAGDSTFCLWALEELSTNPVLKCVQRCAVYQVSHTFKGCTGQ